jgi:ATP-dependent Clp protease ATP-binding subunit ClpC
MALRFPIRTWTRTHDDGSVTVSVLGESTLSLWGPQAAPLVEELELAMSDRIERSHPRLLERLASAPTSEVREVEVPDALILLGPHDADGELARVPTRLSVVVTARGEWRELWIPRLDARLWVDAAADVDAAAISLATELLADRTPSQRLDLRHTGPESLDVLEVEATPAPLARFTGPEGPRDMLPEPAPERSDEDLQRRPDGKVPPPTPKLDEIAQPLHQLARAGRLPRAWEREPDLRRLVDLLAGLSGPIVLVGPRGVGKTAVLDELARRITADDAPLTLRGRPAVFLDADRLVAGDGWFGEWQRQVLDVIQEVAAAEATWFLGALLPLLDAGRSAHSDHNVAQMLGPALATGELRAIGECHDADWAQLQLRNPGFAGLFVPVRLDEPTPAATRRIVDRVASELAEDPLGGATLDAGARAAVVDLARRYGRRDSLVGASVGLLRRVAAAAAAEAATAAVQGHPPPMARVDRFGVVRHVCEETGVPEFLVRDDVPLDRDALAERFARRLLGQPDVVDQMADLVVRIKAGLSDDSRPLGAYLFIGPTGVGKTETVKALAEILYGRAERILRFDMSEFGGADCIDRLLGADPSSGLVGRVAQAPFAVVLLDEIEKAHPAVFDLLLQVLGEARLSDRAGRLADFRNSIVLMTSNLGVGTFRRPAGFGVDVPAALRDHLLGEVRRFFRPELVGRLDAVVAFEPLGAEPIAHITERELAAVRRREGFIGRNVALNLDPAVPGWLAERGVDLRYGARPLKRTIERALVAPVARALSERRHPPRAVRVTVASADSDALGLALTDDASATPARDEALRSALDTLSHLRYALRGWAEVPPFRAARHHLRLVDRLADTRAFWRDEEAARGRLAAVTDPRQVVEAHAALKDQVEALEDLVLEAWAGFVPATDSAPLLAEVAAAEQALADLEWAIAGLEREERDEVTLWFLAADRHSQHQHRTMEPLILAYVRIATRRGWKLRIALRRALYWSDDDVSAEEVHNEAAHWFEHPDELDAFHDISSEGPTLDVHAVLRDNAAPHAVVELRISGRHAATMLAGEAGLHALDHGQDVHDAALVTWPSVGDPAVQRVDLRRPRHRPRQRRILLRRDLLRDYALGRQTGIGRLDEQIEALIRDRMLAAMFGRPR